jgi:hypothetical protein
MGTSASDSIQDLLLILFQQEVILPGHKAIVHDGVLYSDRIYGATGNIGRWAMNTFLRSSASTGHRNDVCLHIDWLVTRIESVLDIHTCNPSVHDRFEWNIGRLLQTISSLMQIYPQMDIPRRRGSINTEQIEAHRVLESCLVRLLDLQNITNLTTIVTNTVETHV